MKFDLSNLEDIFGKDSNDFKDILRSFILDYNEKFPLFKKAVDEKDYLQIGKIAHSFKSVVGNFNLNDIFELAKILEMMGKNNMEEFNNRTLEENFLEFSQKIQDFKNYIEEEYNI